MSSYSPDTPALSIPIGVTLQNLDVFESFYPAIMEQRLTTIGRFFSPIPTFCFTGLDVISDYQLSLRFEKICEEKYEYSKIKNRWVINYGSTNLNPVPRDKNIFMMENIQTGAALMQKEIDFKVRISPKIECENAVLLNSCSKYQAILVVSKVTKNEKGLYDLDGTPQEFKFDCLKFITVSRYRDPQVASIKSSLNGYTKVALAKKWNINIQKNNGAKKDSTNSKSRKRLPTPPVSTPTPTQGFNHRGSSDSNNPMCVPPAPTPYSFNGSPVGNSFHVGSTSSGSNTSFDGYAFNGPHPVGSFNNFCPGIHHPPPGYHFNPPVYSHPPPPQSYVPQVEAPYPYPALVSTHNYFYHPSHAFSYHHFPAHHYF